ncbi:MAG: HEAT repeat domain-containing protein [Pseudanabaena sp. RU_4_16]|nr:HEAT repeat domain-containing protein [Pseudanabaena sp. SU_2_4]NJM27028.1 HEAT repeat domain-containing protein [Pseudanabaena sp. RU_4_16]
MNYSETLLKLCILGLKGDDPVVQQSAISNLGQLANTPYADSALEIILEVANSKKVTVRVQVASALRNFEDPRVESALVKLRNDSDYRVVAATLEWLT